jgi:hypothetical protein
MRHALTHISPVLARARFFTLAAATGLATALILGGTAVSLAATTSVYYDANRNVGAGPNPFNATFTGGDNVALGHTMMPALTTGHNNVASGNFALFSNTSGYYNIASGTNALLNNTTGHDNLAIGLEALKNNTTGTNNVATGTNALISNTTGIVNVASGTHALEDNSTGSYNLASGSFAAALNTVGNENVASGLQALYSNTTGNKNVASGNNALLGNTSGSSNVALGWAAGQNLTSGSNNVAIANNGVAGESGKIRIGTKGVHNTAVLAGVSGASIPGPTQPVVVNANGRLGTATASSARLKRDVRPLAGAATERVLALRPVSYRYKRRHAEGYDRLQYGLLAEQVSRQLPALVQRGPSGRPAGVYYEQLSTLLLSELKRQHRELRRQARELRRLRAQVSGIR